MKDDIREKAQPYIDAGMDEAFAIAIAQGVDSDRVIQLWEADWRKQYPDDDPLIRRILSPNNSLTIEDGEWLNGKRSDHERLVFACIDGVVEIDFAKALLEGGFDDHSDAVINVLDGGEPELIARIRGLEGVENLPPGLGFKVERKLSWDEEKKERSVQQNISKKNETKIVENKSKPTRSRTVDTPFNPFAPNASQAHKRTKEARKNMVGRQDDLKSKQEVAMEALRNRRKKENKKEELKGFLPLNKNYSGYAWFVCNECGFELANVFKQDITSFTCTNCGAVNHRSV